MEDRNAVVVYTEGWLVDSPASKPADVAGLVHARVFVNGQEIPHAHVAFAADGGDFAEVTIKLMPSSFDVVPLRNLADLTSVIEDEPATVEDAVARMQEGLVWIANNTPHVALGVGPHDGCTPCFARSVLNRAAGLE